MKLGLLLNPNARGLRSDEARRALHEASAGVTVAQTAALGEVRAGVEGLLRAGVNVLAVAGGDGALHAAVQELVRPGGRWPGRLAVLQGGTLNIVGRGLGPAARPGAALAALAARWGGRALGELPARQVPLMRVEGEGLGVRHGFIFGSESVKNSLEMYDRFGGGYEGLSRFLFEVARGFAFSTRLWEQEKWRLVPPPFGLSVDEGARSRSVPAYSAAIASTVDLAVGGGVIRTICRQPGARGFFARVITETRTGPLLKMIPALMRERPLGAVLDAPEATALRLHGAYTLDGECFGESSRPPQRPLPLRVEAGGEVSFVVG